MELFLDRKTQGIRFFCQQGENAFTRKELDEIADRLADAEKAAAGGATSSNPLSFIFRPHRNAMTGNYDANVLDSALVSRGKSLVWFNSGKGGIDELMSQVAQYGDDKLLGMIVNFSTKRFLGLCQGRHWVAVRKLKPEGWYNLDSERVAPVCLGEDDGLREFMKNALVVNTDNVVMFVLNGTGAPPPSEVSSTDNDLDGTDNDRVAPE